MLIHSYGKFNLYHNAKQHVLYQPVTSAVEETRQRQIFSFLQQNSSESTATARALNPEAFVARRRELYTPQGRFREGYRKIPHESRKTCEMSTATLSKHSDDENDDFSLLTNLISRRTLNLTILNASPGNCKSLIAVEIESLRRISRYQSFRTFLPLSTARYDDFFRMMNV